jgi:hypothetical protein
MHQVNGRIKKKERNLVLVELEFVNHASQRITWIEKLTRERQGYSLSKKICQFNLFGTEISFTNKLIL